MRQIHRIVAGIGGVAALKMHAPGEMSVFVQAPGAQPPTCVTVPSDATVRTLRDECASQGGIDMDMYVPSFQNRLLLDPQEPLADAGVSAEATVVLEHLANLGLANLDSAQLCSLSANYLENADWEIIKQVCSKLPEHSPTVPLQGGGEECTGDLCKGLWKTLDGELSVEWIKDAKLHGFGMWTWTNGYKYVGAWANGEMHGDGKLTEDRRGTEYVGKFAHNKMNGRGTMRYRDGRVYVGDFEDGYMHGAGAMTYPEGRSDGLKVYDGPWVHGVPESRGARGQACEMRHLKCAKAVFADGRKYEGAWTDGMNGEGGVIYPDGNRYGGHFKGGKRDGQGTMTFLDPVEGHGKWGKKVKVVQIEGLWSDDQMRGTAVRYGRSIGFNVHATYVTGENALGEWKQGQFWEREIIKAVKIKNNDGKARGSSDTIAEKMKKAFGL